MVEVRRRGRGGGRCRTVEGGELEVEEEGGRGREEGWWRRR